MFPYYRTALRLHWCWMGPGSPILICLVLIGAASPQWMIHTNTASCRRYGSCRGLLKERGCLSLSLEESHRPHNRTSTFSAGYFAGEDLSSPVGCVGSRCGKVSEATAGPTLCPSLLLPSPCPVLPCLPPRPNRPYCWSQKT